MNRSVGQILGLLSVVMGALVFYWRSTPDLALAVLAVFMVVWGLITFAHKD